MYRHATRDQPGAEDILALFFEQTEASLAKGRESLQRISAHTEDRDTPATLEVRDAQLDAITAWGIPDASTLIGSPASRNRCSLPTANTSAWSRRRTRTSSPSASQTPG